MSLIKNIGFMILGIILFFGISSVLASDFFYFGKEMKKDIQNYILPARNDFTFYTTMNNNETKYVIIQANGTTSVTGSSMNPTHFEGYEVIWVDYINQPLKQGQIIVFKNDNNNTIAHRIIGVYKDYVITAGDNAKGKETIPIKNIEKIIIGVLYV